ncbi:MAG TPA: hydroxyacid dehydrogenase [Pyrinomonadaceae bacterium]|nr:hydroxyacid dehydrogenase [Pyrinomonadaceae bacterium]
MTEELYEVEGSTRLLMAIQDHKPNRTDGPSDAGSRPSLLVLASDVLFDHFFSEAAQGRLSSVCNWSRYGGREDSSELRDRIAAADALMTTWHSPFLRTEMFGANPRVRLIAHCGGEVKSRAEQQLIERIMVTNAAEPMAQPVAEMALSLILTLVRRIPEYAAEMRAGIVRTNDIASEGETICGRNVGLIGFGRIGQAFSDLIRPFGSRLFVADPYRPSETVRAHGGRPVLLDELLRSCSVVVLAAGLTPETRNLLDKKRLALMADGSYLINVARGGLIDTEALLAELRTGRLTAALDVTDPLEPLPVDHELRRLPNVLLTPHIAAGGIEMRRAIGDIAVEEVCRFFRGEQPQNVVTREMLATMT